MRKKCIENIFVNKINSGKTRDEWVHNLEFLYSVFHWVYLYMCLELHVNKLTVFGLTYIIYHLVLGRQHTLL